MERVCLRARERATECLHGGISENRLYSGTISLKTFVPFVDATRLSKSATVSVLISLERTSPRNLARRVLTLWTLWRV